VNDDLAGGADIIKLFTGSWIARGKVKPMPVDVAIAAVEEAHKHGKLVFTHPSNVAGLEVALAAHVDVLAHSIEDMRGWNNSYLTRMKAANMALIPTLKLFGSDDDLPEFSTRLAAISAWAVKFFLVPTSAFFPITIHRTSTA
jgi:hypothetical protein